jgi:thiol-disulfide isomerase/thioredoxin
MRNVETNKVPKIIVLEFWATWCAPCVAAIPHINSLSDKYKDNVTFISITDEKPCKIEEFLKRKEMKTTVVTDTTRSTLINFKINSLPSTMIINTSGILVWSGNPTWLNDSILSAVIDGKVLFPKNNKFIKENEVKNINKSDDISFTINVLKPGEANQQISAEKISDSAAYIKLYNLNIATIVRKYSGMSSHRIIQTGNRNETPLSILFLSSKPTFKNNSEAHEFILSTLSNLFNFRVRKIQKQYEAFVFSITDKTKFEKCKNKDIKEGSHLSSNEEEVIGTNITLTQLIGSLEEDFEIILNKGRLKDEKLDISYPISDFEKAKLYLEKQYGISLIRKKCVTDFMEIEFN